MGAGADSAGFIWGVSAAGYVGRVTPGRMDAFDRVVVGSGPYTYSDFTGFNMRTASAGAGQYKLPVNGCENGPTNWLSVAITGLVPPRTAISVVARVAETAEALGEGEGDSAGPFSLTPDDDPFPVEFEGLPEHRFMMLSFGLVGHEEATPLLRSFNVEFQCRR